MRQPQWQLEGRSVEDKTQQTTIFNTTQQWWGEETVLDCQGSMNCQSQIQGILSLLVLAGCITILKPSSINLQTFLGCAVREFTFLARKPGCKGLRITTDACWGRCETWEKPVVGPPYIEAHHRVCTYNESQLVTVKLPNCAASVDPFYTYPKAIRCACSVCLTETTECETI